MSFWIWDALKARFRRIQCGPSPGPFSWEPFDSITAAEKDWGRQAIVGNFTEERLAAFRARTGGEGVEVAPLCLEEIFLSLDGTAGGLS